MSESTGPKTWGDVIKREANGDCHAISPAGMTPVNPGIESVASLVARIGQSKTEVIFGLAPGTSAIAFRWLYLGCPPLTDPVPPETPEPVAKVVRWEPTEEDMDAIRDRYLQWNDDQWDSQALMDVIKDAIRDCQRDLPEAEPPTPPTDRIADIESRLAALESRAILKPDYDPRDVALMPSTAPLDGWQVEPPTVDCPCWIETKRGAVCAVTWRATENAATSWLGDAWYSHEIKRYYPCPHPMSRVQPSPNLIGRSAYNTPTTFEEALMVEPQATPEPEIPLPEGCTEVEGFPLLCLSRKGNVRPRSREYFFLTWSDGHAAWMKACGCSQDEIKQAARYAIGQIARDAGLDVVVK